MRCRPSDSTDSSSVCSSPAPPHCGLPRQSPRGTYVRRVRQSGTPSVRSDSRGTALSTGMAREDAAVSSHDSPTMWAHRNVQARWRPGCTRVLRDTDALVHSGIPAAEQSMPSHRPTSRMTNCSAECSERPQNNVDSKANTAASAPTDAATVAIRSHAIPAKQRDSAALFLSISCSSRCRAAP
jgi:urease accessory protein UreF